jgi:hypothetical protein
MRFIPRHKTLTPEETALVNDPDHRMKFATDLNEQEARKHFKEMPFAKVLISPRFWWFRD